MTTPRRGLRFEHAHWRTPIAGVRFDDCPPVVCRVTKVTPTTVYYRAEVEGGGTGNPWYCSPETFPEKVARRLDDAPLRQPTDAPVRLAATGGSGSWHGAIRQGSRTLVDCGHAHANRDTGYSGSARQCITTRIRAARSPELAVYVLGAAAASAAGARRMGARITDEEARAKAAANLDEIRSVLDATGFPLPTKSRTKPTAAWSTRSLSGLTVPPGSSSAS